MDLDRLFRPRSIAILGGGWAENVVAQCRKMGFAGQVWPVHPTRSTLGGLPTYASLKDLPGAPDACFIGVNRHATIDVVGQLARMGAGGAVCFASGFSETGADDLQAQLVVAAGKMPVLGPNCYGVINYLDGALMWPDQHGGQRVDRGVGLISQSSNIVINLTMQTRALPVAYVACVGNAAQTGTAQIARAMLADDRVTALGFYIEGIGNAQEFAALAHEALAAGKPLVVLKSGKSDAAQAAAASHTASLAGAGAASSAYFRSLGVAEVDDLPELLEVLKILHCHGPIAGQRVGAMCCSGGEAGLVADLARDMPLEFPHPATATQLREVLGEIPAISNPLDYHTFIWGDQPRMTQTYTEMLSGGYDAGLLVMDFPHETRCSSADWEPAVNAWVAAAQATGLPAVLVASLPDALPESRAASLMARGVVPIAGLSVALRALAVCANWPQASAGWAPLSPNPTTKDQPTLLDEATAKAHLRALGVPVPQGAVCTNDFSAAESLSPPLALKALGLAHKSESGGVRLNLSAAALAQAAAQMPHTAAFLVEEMATGGVAELLIGLQRDPVYGATLTLGSGGVLTELLADSVTLVLPVSAAQVLQALQRLRLFALLDGYRGRPRADVDAAVQIVLRLAQAFANDARLVELEINPLILRASDQGAIAVDALIQTTGEIQ